ncbi:hypothetical protein C2G38_2193674 [Gigaspora rosea]|uniref:Uncharacterized protein n=1 Tax=Gigaspora rosea TaxID=44941 RepID=A0A397UZW6_9GLOM|nr:hypothetical protein C2G38_2193674 [Gigaspora rosea]
MFGQKKKKTQYNYQYRTPILPKPINNPPTIPYVRPPVNLQRLPYQVIIDQDVQYRLNQGYKPPNLAPPRPPLKPLELKNTVVSTKLSIVISISTSLITQTSTPTLTPTITQTPQYFQDSNVIETLAILGTLIITSAIP